MQAKLDIVGIVVDDMARSLAFYRQLGIDLPAEADQQPHVDVELPGGLRLAWDTVETIHSFDPEGRPPSGGRGRVSLAFRFDTYFSIVQYRRPARPDARMPFHHLKTDGFWTAHAEDGAASPRLSGARRRCRRL